MISTLGSNSGNKITTAMTKTRAMAVTMTMTIAMTIKLSATKDKDNNRNIDNNNDVGTGNDNGSDYVSDSGNKTMKIALAMPEAMVVDIRINSDNGVAYTKCNKSNTCSLSNLHESALHVNWVSKELSKPIVHINSYEHEMYNTAKLALDISNLLLSRTTLVFLFTSFSTN